MVKKFAQSEPFPFPLLIDENRSEIKAFDVYHPIGIDAFNIARPSTFLIDADGRIAFSYIGKSQFDRPGNSLVYKEVQPILGETFNDHDNGQ